MQRRLSFLILFSILLASCRPAVATATPTGIPAAASSTPVTVTATAPSVDTPLPPAPNLPVADSPTLIRIHFLDAHYSWGIASNGSGAILRSVDGGLTWLNATPPGLTGIGYSTELSVLNINTVWALIPNADFFTGMLYHTTDGGVNWTSNPVPFGGGNLQFLDASTGRILADQGVGAGSQAVEMFQTGDSGVTWTSVFTNNPTRSGSSDSLPFSGIKNGMIFLDASTGFITGTRPVDGEVYFFVTRDGGASWSMQNIPLPEGYKAYQYMPQAPVFFGNDGFLPLMIYYPDATVLTFYITHDGGATWTKDLTNERNVILTPGLYAFADSLHGWCWDGSSNLYVTTDGAQTWTQKTTDLDLGGRLGQIQFSPDASGQFTGWVLTGPDDAGHSQIYQTSDNGSTWMPLIP
jgi:photosystem II stability/assembly factor-like uncharacterized protein